MVDLKQNSERLALNIIRTIFELECQYTRAYMRIIMSDVSLVNP